MLPKFLPNLQYLKLRCNTGFMIAEHDLLCLQPLSRLQTLDLCIESNGQWNRRTLRPLQHLTALRAFTLRISGSLSCPMLLDASLSKLTLLTVLRLEHYIQAEPGAMLEGTQNVGGVIGSCTSLQELGLSGIVVGIPGQFSRLQNLQSLTMEGWALTPGLITEQVFCGITSLSCLQTLQVNFHDAGQMDPCLFSPLQHLTALRSLNICLHHLQPGSVVLDASLSKLRLLTALRLHCECSRVSEDMIHRSCIAAEVISSFTLLQSLDLRCVFDRIPHQLSLLLNLQCLTIGDRARAKDLPNFSVQPSFSRCTKLTALCLNSFSIPREADWLGTMSALAGLPSLSNIELEEVDLNSIAADRWAFPSCQTNLDIACCELKTFPKAIVSQTSIRSLSLSANYLADLPAGPYLEHLTTLNITSNSFTSFLDSLSVASSLKALHIDNEEPWVDVDKLTSILPQDCELVMLNY